MSSSTTSRINITGTLPAGVEARRRSATGTHGGDHRLLRSGLREPARATGTQTWLEARHGLDAPSIAAMALQALQRS